MSLRGKILLLFLFSLLLIKTISADQGKVHPALQNAESDSQVKIIIEFNEGIPYSQDEFTEYGCETGKVLTALYGLAIRCPSSQIYMISQDQRVKYVWEDEVLYPVIDQSVPLINAPLVWQQFGNGTGVNVSVIDTGINKSHTALAGQVVLEQDFTTENFLDDRCNHGTPVACIVGCVNETYTGVAPGVKIFNAKAGQDIGPQCAFSSSDIIEAIDWSIANGAQVIQMSLGSFVNTCYQSPTAVAVNNSGKNIMIVVAAGNSGPGAGTIGTPGCAETVLTVGASNGNQIADFSSRGPTDYGLSKPDVVAPGVDIDSAGGSGQGFSNGLAGTSFSAPHVAGVVALMMQKNPGLTPFEVKTIINETAFDLGFGINDQGGGRVDAFAAVLATPNITPTPVLITTPAVPNGSKVAQPFVINATISNDGSAAALNVTALLATSQNLTILDAAMKSLGTIAEGAAVVVNWTANASLPRNYTANITTGASNAVQNTTFFPVRVIFEVHINFQPGGSPMPAGYVNDSGRSFGNRGNNFSYGWNALNNHARDRNNSLSPDQRYDTLNHMQKPSNPNASWRLAVPNGTYNVHIVAGDPSYIDSVYRIFVEGKLAINSTPNSTVHWFEKTLTVNVTDTRLTITNAPGSSNNKINFIDVISV